MRSSSDDSINNNISIGPAASTTPMLMLAFLRTPDPHINSDNIIKTHHVSPIPSAIVRIDHQ
jgi:hypothetical protein